MAQFEQNYPLQVGEFNGGRVMFFPFQQLLQGHEVLACFEQAIYFFISKKAFKARVINGQISSAEEVCSSFVVALLGSFFCQKVNPAGRRSSCHHIKEKIFRESERIAPFP
jgi:hypothetical protein